MNPWVFQHWRANRASFGWCQPCGRLAAFAAIVIALAGCGQHAGPQTEIMVSLAGHATSPLDGATVRGEVRITVTPRPEYQRVAFILGADDGSDPLETVHEPPYELILDTSVLGNGEHTLNAVATMAGHEATRSAYRATFIVANALEPDDAGQVPPYDPTDPTYPPIPPMPPVPGDMDTSPRDGPSPEYAHLRQLYVSPTGSDSNEGSTDEPLRTVMEGVRRAVANRKQGHGTRINLDDGVYREALVGSYSSSGPLIVIEARTSGRAVVSGSDVFTEWSCNGGVCHHEWSHRWGADPNPWGFLTIGELARRREMVLVDGVNLEQVSSLSHLMPGSFFVDESSGQVLVKPPPGVQMTSAIVEVAVRPYAMRLQGLNDLVFAGIRFQHAATPFRRAAVEIVDQRDVLLDRSIVAWNGQTGVWVKGERFTIRNTVMNNNGSSGVAGFQVADLLLEGNDTSHNNWRGVRGDYTGWEVGQKLFSAHRVTIRGHTSTHNQSYGFWLDTDIQDVVIEGSLFCDNRSDGMFIERVQGPVVVRDSTFCRNGRSGILTSATHGLTLEGNRIELNHRSAVHISGDFAVTFTDFETGQPHTVSNERWTWMNNTMVSAGSTPVITTTHPRHQWERVMGSSTLDLNAYAAGTETAFTVPTGQKVTLHQWQADTGQDGRSQFTSFIAAH